MAEHTPLEKLQPCLLDRLTDDEPHEKEESRNQRVISIQKYKRGVLRDLDWLFNANAHLSNEGGGDVSLDRFPEAEKSVINYGIRHLCGLIAPNMDDLERALVQAIQVFEPRILRHSVQIKASMVRNMITFELHGEIWANPVPEELFINTKVDLEGGLCIVGDRAEG
jgi:type VI secretion system protein ImpF